MARDDRRVPGLLDRYMTPTQRDLYHRNAYYRASVDTVVPLLLEALESRAEDVDARQRRALIRLQERTLPMLDMETMEAVLEETRGGPGD